jgi:tetratricopeptide (TPR) repeat protein
VLARVGPYELHSEIGRGGSGAVYRARSADGRSVAVKVLRGLDPDLLAQFDREKRLLWSLTQAEGFVPVLDAGEHAGARYLVMPLFEAGTLRDRIRGGPLAPEEAVALVRQVALALGRAHERGIVHRDLKPENVIFTGAGVPLVADLGMAKHFRRDVLGASQSHALSNTTTIAGTPGYMAPEQIRDARDAGPASDVFALGVVLHECLAGERPFPADGILGYVAALEKGPHRLPDGIPSPLRAAVARALAKDPRKRFADAGAFAEALAATGSTPPGRALGLPGVAGLIAALVLGVVLALGGLVRWRESARREEEEAARKHEAERLAGEATEKKRDALQLTRSAADALDHGDADQALRDATRAIELDPGLAIAWLDRGAAKGKKGDLDGEIADETRGIELDPKNAGAWAKRAHARCERDDPDGAIADASRAIELDPRLGVAWVDRALAHVDKGELDAGLADVSRAIDIAPKLATAWATRGAIRGSRDDWDGEIEDATRALELDPTLVHAWVNRGVARASKGDLEGEIEDETRAIELDPNLQQAWLNRAAARRRSRDPEGAIADATRAIELAPRHPGGWVDRGLARGDQGDVDGDIADMTRAIELAPRLALAWKERGRARREKGDRAGSRADFERMLELDPDDPEAPVVRRYVTELAEDR